MFLISFVSVQTLEEYAAMVKRKVTHSKEPQTCSVEDLVCVGIHCLMSQGWIDMLIIWISFFKRKHEQSSELLALTDLLKKRLNPNGNERITPSQALQHDFIKMNYRLRAVDGQT